MTTPISDAARARAETLFERVARLARAFDPPPALPDADVATALEPWRRAAAGEDGDALRRRLAWDGIDARIAALAFVPAEGGAGGAWSDAMERWLHAAGGFSRSALGAELARELPFAELVTPWVDAAAERASAAADVAAGFAPEAWRSWREALSRRLSWIAAPSLFARFERERTERGGAGAYARYLERERGDGFAALAEEFPGLVRQLAERAADWVEATVELAGRLAADRAALARRFGGGDPGRVAGLEAGLSDPHARGRRVLALRFDSGLELIYKPRPVALEAFFERACADLTAAGFELAPRAARTLDRGGHGWMERVRPADLADEAATRAWFRRAGALAALAWLLGGRDLHAENLIAAADGPVLVDAEMLLAPVDLESNDSVLATGLVADPEAADGPGAWGYAGLDLPDGAGMPGEERVWSGVGGDDLALAWRPPPAPARANVARCQGRAQRPEVFREEIVEGFERAARFLLGDRDRLTGPAGALAQAPAATTRVLFRPSAQYATTVALSVRPRYLADGLAASLLREALLRPLVRSVEKPAIWPLVAEERSALEALDLPVFRIEVGATALATAAGARIEGLFDRSGWAAARARLAALDEAAILRESGRLAAALAPRRLPAAEEERRLAEAAGAIAAALAGAPAFAAVEAAGASLRGLALYGGLAGRALFAAGAARATGAARWRELAEELSAGLGAALARADGGETRPGATDGWGSLIWTGATLAELLDRPAPLEIARRAAERLAAAPDGDGRWGWDLAAGEAGALLALLALAEADPASGALAAARERGERLLAAQIDGGEAGGAWPAPGGAPALAGFAHGASGIARALTALGDATGDPRFDAAAARAIAWERGLLDRGRRDWPVRVAGSGAGKIELRFLGSWCHGAPGVALARALRLARGEESAARADLDVALAFAADAALPAVDHLCCGTAGRLAALAAAGRLLGAEPALAAGRRLARRALARAQGAGGWRVSPGEVPGERADLGFFRGFPGLAWSLISLTPAGAELPLVAALELPSERRRRLRSAP